MNFSQYTQKLPELMDELKQQPLRNRGDLKGIPKAGVYVFYKNGKPLYVGRSNRMKERILEHGRKGSGYCSAQFAFNLAKGLVGFEEKDRSLATRKEMESAPGFDKAFFLTKLEVAKMKVRVIDIEDQILQALFEIFAHLELGTKYNDFKTH